MPWDALEKHDQTERTTIIREEKMQYLSASPPPNSRDIDVVGDMVASCPTLILPKIRHRNDHCVAYAEQFAKEGGGIMEVFQHLAAQHRVVHHRRFPCAKISDPAKNKKPKTT